MYSSRSQGLSSMIWQAMGIRSASCRRTSLESEPRRRERQLTGQPVRSGMQGSLHLCTAARSRSHNLSWLSCVLACPKSAYLIKAYPTPLEQQKQSLNTQGHILHDQPCQAARSPRSTMSLPSGWVSTSAEAMWRGTLISCGPTFLSTTSRFQYVPNLSVHRGLSLGTNVRDSKQLIEQLSSPLVSFSRLTGSK